MKRLAVTMQILAVSLSGCGEADPGTSVQVSLLYDDGLALDTADVTVGNRTQSGRIEHQLLLLVPDALASSNMPIEVWARRDGKRAAYGTTTAVPVRGETVSASVTLLACTPGCNGDQLMTCTGSGVACALGCSEEGDPHCVAPRPSNGVDPGLAGELNGMTTIASDTTFHVDTGEITGGVTRPPGTGNVDGIVYLEAPAFAAGGAPLGIFVFSSLAIEEGATVRITGSRAAVLLVGDTAKIAGTVDVAAGEGQRSTPGPGGGAGGTAVAAAQGCGPGGSGQPGTLRADGGGGGGGAGTAGALGGDGTRTGETGPGGTAGMKCLAASLEPLQGGSGGGRGGHVQNDTYASGGGGGGALQITALVRLEISGTIHAGGAGGEGGPVEKVLSTGAGAGGGGGSGGAILLEAPTVVIASSSVLAANGGGGGGAGADAVAGAPGENARASLTAAAGGTGDQVGSDGGDGGVLGVAPGRGQGSGVANGGGGGGAVGAIVIRGRSRMVAGMITPGPTLLDVQF